MSSFPLRHLSIRVPWHDSGWIGTVCQRPALNSACLKLKNISAAKDDAREEKLAGQAIKDFAREDLPPCAKERATFMAPFSWERFHEHPYAKTSPNTHSHFAPTRLHHPAYAAAALPFRWLMKREVQEVLQKQHPLDHLDLSREPELPFETNWLQDRENHLQVLETFWGYVRPVESLVFFYAKQVPFVEDTTRRVLVGVGRVSKIGALTEYEYHGSLEGKIRSMMWERMVVHSIRPGGDDGFLMPYQSLLEAAEKNPGLDLAECAVFAPDERFEEFSYATEHVTDDSAIAALLALREGVRKAATVLPDFDSREPEAWIDRELGRLWRERGAFPGLGAVLCAFGVHLGHFAAHAIRKKAGQLGDPWPFVDEMFRTPASVLPAEIAPNVDVTLGKAWSRLTAERRAYLQLLARLNLTDSDAVLLYDQSSRQQAGIPLSDLAVLENPYRLYEATRLTLSPVTVPVIDRGVFPVAAIREKQPVPEPSRVTTAVDARRLRALVIAELERAALAGDTLRPREAVIAALRAGHEEDAATAVTEDLLSVAEEGFGGEVCLVKMGDGRIAYQLERLAQVGELIRDKIAKRISQKGKPLYVEADWRERLNKRLGPIPDGVDREVEERARDEKAAALGQLASGRFSVLIGPAGTGKTTLLSVLCAHPDIADGHILLLAPTGKARVRMEAIARQAQTENFKAATLAQFLWGSERFDGATGRYQLQPDAPSAGGARTVIVDEASMLTEEMLAALLESLSGVHRLILVGDPAQLPPIGAGRPFVDIIRQLQPEDIESRFPRVAPAYVELTIPRRQSEDGIQSERDDVLLASWFAARANGPADDQIFDILAGRRSSPHLRLLQWETAADLVRLLPQVLAEELGFPAGEAAEQAFDESLGGSEYRGRVYFHSGRMGPHAKEQEPDRIRQLHGADRWQVLSPVRQKPWGIDEVNHLLHRSFRTQRLAHARQHAFERITPPPLGAHQLLYGDKVINNRNHRPSKNRIYDPNGSGVSYLANGEIGLIVGELRTKTRKWVPKNAEVEFSTQPGVKYTFYASDFAEESEESLELAYALTVHKAQGSEFGRVFLVLPRSTVSLSRELLYTALTRQKEKVILLHQGPATELQTLSRWEYSSAARRLTNLFCPPTPREIEGTFLEERLIHLTAKGDLVRSKSEVIIANLLHAKGIRYKYELPLVVDGFLKYPDFTIEDEDLGITYYWEHCGMLHDPAYARRWEEKLRWYREHEIKPHEEGGGTRGTLIITRDSSNGGISSPEISCLIERLFDPAV